MYHSNILKLLNMKENYFWCKKNIQYIYMYMYVIVFHGEIFFVMAYLCVIIFSFPNDEKMILKNPRGESEPTYRLWEIWFDAVDRVIQGPRQLSSSRNWHGVYRPRTRPRLFNFSRNRSRVFGFSRTRPLVLRSTWTCFWGFDRTRAKFRRLDSLRLRFPRLLSYQNGTIRNILKLLGKA